MAHFWRGGYCYIKYDGERIFRGESLRVPDGATLTACYDIHLGLLDKKVAVQVWDYTDWKELSWKEYTSSSTDCVDFVITGAGESGQPKRHDIRFVLYEYKDGKWKQVETYGPFYIDVVLAAQPPTPPPEQPPEEQPPEEQPPEDRQDSYQIPIELAALGIGLLTILFGTIAFMEYERQRMLELMLLKRET